MVRGIGAAQELEPGSLVVCATHTAHRVEPTAEWRPHRLAYAHFMKKADEETGYVTPPSTLPPVWSLRARRGELPAALCELLQNGHDRELTGVLNCGCLYLKPTETYLPVAQRLVSVRASLSSIAGTQQLQGVESSAVRTFSLRSLAPSSNAAVAVGALTTP